MTYEIRKDGRTYCWWDDPSCTPSKEILRQMKQAGYKLYINGKLQK